MTIKIYELCSADTEHLFSPHCWKTRYSVAHKGLGYETIPTPFTSVATLEGGVDRTVPVIRDGDHVLHDSLEIALYLDATYPDSPLVSDLALTRFVVSWSQSQLHPAVTKLSLLDIYDSLADIDKEFFRRTREKIFGCTLEEFSARHPKDGKELNRVLVPMNLMLRKQKFFGGESPVFADYVVFGALQWLRVCSKTSIEVEDLCGDWFERMLDLYDSLGRSVRSAS